MVVIRSRTARLAGVGTWNSLFKLLPSLQLVHDCMFFWVVFQGGSVMDGQFTLEKALEKFESFKHLFTATGQRDPMRSELNAWIEQYGFEEI